MAPRYKTLVNIAKRNSSSFSREETILRPWKRLGESWVWTLIFQLLGLLWLAPTITFLIFHFETHIIGASAWCPTGKCSADPLSHRAIERAQALDEYDHNTLGVLQLVAKALEVWFVFIATSLVYNVTMMLASSGNGLPIGFLMTHVEFTDLRKLFDKLLWITPTSPTPTTSGKRPSAVALYLFAFFAASMCVLANLMGPAAAVLVLPTLQWVDTPTQLEQKFNKTGLADPPTGDSVFYNCSDAVLAARKYSCNAGAYAAILDSLVDSSGAAIDQSIVNPFADTGGAIITQELNVGFAFNVTENTNFVSWAPNRQVLRGLNKDLAAFANITLGGPSDQASDQLYYNSLQTILKRSGPIIGIRVSFYMAQNVSVTNIALDKQIRCFDHWQPSPVSDTYYTKCIRVGTGWNVADSNASFAISEIKSSSIAVNVDVYFSDKAAYFNSTFNPGSIPLACIANGSVPSNSHCDWDKFFSPPNLPQSLANMSSNILTLQLGTPDVPSNPQLLIELAVHNNFSTYSLDTSPSTNPHKMVKVDDITDLVVGEHAIVHPDWLLAAWSVNQNGVLTQDRAAASALVRSVKGLGSSTYDSALQAETDLLLIGVFSALQAMSMVEYYYTTPGPSAVHDDPFHPIFHRYATIYVWAFGNASRTSKLGVVVVIAGMTCVLIRTLLLLVVRTRQRSTTELVVAALEHQPQGEFAGVRQDDEKATAKVRYAIGEDESGRFRYWPVSRYASTTSSGAIPDLQGTPHLGYSD